MQRPASHAATRRKNSSGLERRRRRRRCQKPLEPPCCFARVSIAEPFWRNKRDTREKHCTAPSPLPAASKAGEEGKHTRELGPGTWDHRRWRGQKRGPAMFLDSVTSTGPFLWPRRGCNKNAIRPSPYFLGELLLRASQHWSSAGTGNRVSPKGHLTNWERVEHCTNVAPPAAAALLPPPGCTGTTYGLGVTHGRKMPRCGLVL